MRSCYALGVLVLSAQPASAARVVVQTKQCGYQSLLQAEVAGVPDGVRVKVCGEEVVLKSEHPTSDAWKSLNWWDPALQGASLTPEELETLDNYLGSYDYARPMGQIGHGQLPKHTTSAVKGVLSFEVLLGNALNKLPASGVAQLYRGGWTSMEQLQEMQAALDSGSAINFPWFQSTSSDSSHASTFMGRKSEPQTCANECIEKGAAFPTYLTFETRHGKDVSEWNAAEKEWLLLPSLRFKVASITKIMNDPWWEASPKDMADWLGQVHTVPTNFWSRKGKMSYGPWPELAAACLAHSIDGQGFLKWWANRSFPEPYAPRWDESEYLHSDKHMEFQYASYTRFQLPTLSTRAGPGPNTVQFYYRINLQDAP
ncbi:unnamed protein product [Effrenium voratum]|uniref:Uncharacterized protein n=1 Tax=Effrenium voratum TaxID=2562239 RepID=A0AA36IT73_9DINO|nr:unnamed protein product [Effrenium voratum]